MGFFLYLRKRAKRIAEIELDTEWSELQRSVENIMTDWLGLPALAAAHGGQIDSLIGWIHVFMLILFVGWGGFFLYVPGPFPAIAESGGELRGRQVAHVDAISRSAWPWSKRFSCSDSRSRCGPRGSIACPPESEALVVQVTGEQFAWNIHYAGPDGVFGRTDIKLLDLQSNPLGLDRDDPAAKDDVTTLNQLYLPVNKPIIVRLRSKDVIHSFGVPEFRVKQDAIPGLTIPIWFVPTVTTAEMRTRTGNPEFQYEIACAQLCGLGHYRMRGFVTVQTAEEFQKWMDDEQASSRSRAAARGVRTERNRPARHRRTEHLRRRHPRADPLELLDGHAVEAALAAGLLDGPDRPSRGRTRGSSSCARRPHRPTRSSSAIRGRTRSRRPDCARPRRAPRGRRAERDPANVPGVWVQSGSSAIRSPVIP